MAAADSGIPATGQHVLRRRASPQARSSRVARSCDGRVRATPEGCGVGDAVDAGVPPRWMGSRIDRDEMQTYVSALATCGYRIDSSDAAGVFGDRTWRVGTAFGTNVYRLPGELIELAPSWSLTCGAPLISRQGLVALAG